MMTAAAMGHTKRAAQLGTACALLLITLLLAACASRHRVPRTAAACAQECAAARSACLKSCAESTGHLEILEEVRESLCGKRCNEDFDRCMFACPGVQ